MNVQLIDARTDRHLWAGKFDRDLTNVFKMRNEVVEAIARQIQAKISPEQSSRLSNAHTINPAAFQEYLIGRQSWNRGTENGLGDALNHLNRATEIEPSFALAWAGLADAYWWIADSTLPASEALTKTKAAALRALELDDSLAEAYTALAAAEFSIGYEWTKAEEDFQHAIKLKPNYAIARWQYGWLLAVTGRFDEAINEMQRAIELDPLSAWMTLDLNVPYALKKDYERAIAQCHKALELDRSFYLPHMVLGWIEVTRHGDYAKAIEEFHLAQTMETQPALLAFLGYGYARSGQKGKAAEMLQELGRLRSRRFVSSYCEGLIYLGLDDHGHAMDWLEKAYDERSPWLEWLKVEPVFDPLRSNPRFQALYKKMNFPL